MYTNFEDHHKFLLGFENDCTNTDFINLPILWITTHFWIGFGKSLREKKMKECTKKILYISWNSYLAQQLKNSIEFLLIY